MSTIWDPAQYLRFADERARPFYDLIARIAVESPQTVVDLGCGPGNMTAVLADRWPEARVLGIDSSEEMITRASELGRPGRLEFRRADLTDWRPDGPVDVIVSNATLHWVPDHLALLPRLAASLAPGGCLAFQVPGNFGQPSHVLMRELALSEQWRDRLAEAVETGPASHDAAVYLRTLLGGPRPGRCDVWETTYYHVLEGADPVLNWVKGTGLRPILDALEEPAGGSEGGCDQFLSAYGAALRAAYPKGSDGRTVFPFRRIFGVFCAS